MRWPVDVTVMPFCSGGESASPVALRRAYLEATVESAAAFSRLIVVGVCSDADAAVAAEELRGLGPGRGHVWRVDVSEGGPRTLPIELCLALQRAGSSPSPVFHLGDGAVVCYTEADQQLTVARGHARFLLSRPAEERAFLSGHRLEELLAPDMPVPAGFAGCRLEDGRRFVLANELPPSLGGAGGPSGGAWYRPADWMLGFSASFVCTARTFREIAFRFPFAPDVLIESPSICAFMDGACYKTIACDLGESALLTVHLSGAHNLLGAPRRTG